MVTIVACLSLFVTALPIQAPLYVAGDFCESRIPSYICIRDVVDIAASEDHVLVVTESGEVYAAGSNEYGELGLPIDVDYREAFTKVEGLPYPAVAAACGRDHSLVLLKNGEVYAFGRNYDGQLGVEGRRARYFPTKVKGLPNTIVTIAAGDAHSLVLSKNGDIYAFGNNDYGQLGLGLFPGVCPPTKIEGIPAPAVAIAAGCNHSLVLLENGDVYGFGSNHYGQLGPSNVGNYIRRPIKIGGLPEPVVAIAAGCDHSLVLLENGDVYAFGKMISPTPSKVEGLPEPVIAIACGSDSSIFLLESGKIYAFGELEEFKYLHTPRMFSCVPQNGIRIFAGGGCIFVQLINGDLYFYNTGRCINLLNNLPVQIGCALSIKLINSFSTITDSLIVLENGDVYRKDPYGFDLIEKIPGPAKDASAADADILVLLKNGDVFSLSSKSIIKGLPSPAADIASGSKHFLLLLANGDVYAFGGNDSGQLGLGDEKRRTVPTKIVGLPEPAKAIACGSYHSLVLLENGEVYAFGSNSYGQLGLGDKEDRAVPTKIVGLPGPAKAIACGLYYSLVLLENGDVYAFGSNSQGQLGLGNKEDRAVPTKIVGLPGPAKAIACGSYHSLVLLENGEVYAFGSNSYGQLGLGDKEDRAVPTKIECLPATVKAIYGGETFSLFVLSLERNADRP